MTTNDYFFEKQTICLLMHLQNFALLNCWFFRGCLTQEKIVASCAETFVVIADDRW